MSFPDGFARTVVLVCALSLASLASAAEAFGADPRNDRAFASADFSTHQRTGLLRFAGVDRQSAVKLNRVPGRGDSEDYGLAFARAYGPSFGIDDPAAQLALVRSRGLAAGGSHLRYRQVHDGVPVFAGELVINLDQHNALLSMGGEISPDLSLSTSPSFSAQSAAETALLALAKWRNIDPAELVASEPELTIYDARLLKPSDLEPSLAWKVVVTSRSLLPINELLLIDAHKGNIRLHFNQIHLAKDRSTHDAEGTDSLPGTLVCSEGDAFPVCAAGDTDVENAHDFAGDTYDFYNARHGRDGIDDLGSPLVSTTHWDDGSICPNAFWNGAQMVYCDLMANADDVVGHEMTHGVTSHESGLFYYYQSGAINESFSDIWGEFVDLTNGKGDDSASSRWILGEDLGFVIRDMRDPGTVGDPDRMTSPNYWTSYLDGGGVHINSGINNKAAYLLTDGDTFNGFTVQGLGIDKTAKIYYEAQTNLLTSGSDYADLYNYLHQACLILVGSEGITVDDCDQVRKATQAVEMNLDPAGDPSFSPEAAFCPQNYAVGAILFADDLEATPVNWNTSTLEGTNNDWVWLAGYATSGTSSIYADDIGAVSDSVAWTVNPILLPAGAYLHFKHSFGFEADQFGDGFDHYYDGGVIEYSIDGSTWEDLGPLHADGQDYLYEGDSPTIDDSYGNPLGGRHAFVSESHGYVSSRYDLSSLSGEDFQVRFRVGSDEIFGGPLGWAVDDVMIYQCDALFDESCSGTDVLIQSREFTGESTCLADNSLVANTAVVVKAGANVRFRSPSTALGAGFIVEAGAQFSVETAL